MKMKRVCTIAMPAVLFIFCTSAASAQLRQTQQTQVVVYNSILNPLPDNIASEGPESHLFVELGDGLNVQETGGSTLGKVTVILSSWACQSGTGTSACTTIPNGATFRLPITISVYSVNYDYDGSPTPARRLASITQFFNIPYRRTHDTTGACLNAGDTTGYNATDGQCYHGRAVPIFVDFSSQSVRLPANNKVIVTVAYNTTHYGPHPIGEKECFRSPNGCPYDSLNIGTEGNGPTGLTVGIGSLLDYNGIFLNQQMSGQPCTVNTVTGKLAVDTPCWTGLHPQIKVEANSNTSAMGVSNTTIKPHSNGKGR